MSGAPIFVRAFVAILSGYAAYGVGDSLPERGSRADNPSTLQQSAQHPLSVGHDEIDRILVKNWLLHSSQRYCIINHKEIVRKSTIHRQGWNVVSINVEVDPMNPLAQTDHRPWPLPE